MSDGTRGTAASFEDIVRMIDAARERAYQTVNTALIDLYWQIGEQISRKIAAAVEAQHCAVLDLWPSPRPGGKVQGRLSGRGAHPRAARPAGSSCSTAKDGGTPSAGRSVHPCAALAQRS